MTSLLNDHIQSIIIAFTSSTDNFLIGLSNGLTYKPLSLIQIYIIALCNSIGSYIATTFGNSIDQYFTLILSLLLYPHNNNNNNNNNDSSLIQYCIAGIAFLYLAYREYYNSNNINETTIPLADSNCEKNQYHRTEQRNGLSSLRHTFELAVPMTINNLAGGVATGIAGISPIIASIYAFTISVITMYIGHQIGSYIIIRQQRLRHQRKNDNSNNTVQNHQKQQPLDETLRIRQNAIRWSILLYCFLSIQAFYNAYVA